MYTITKEFHFSAAHSLDHLRDGHPCKNIHGHNYIVELVLSSKDLDKNHFVIDYNDLSSFKKWIDDVLDHKNLNHVMGGLPSTAENLAHWLYEAWRGAYPMLVAVRVSETPKTWAEYRPEVS